MPNLVKAVFWEMVEEAVDVVWPIMQFIGVCGGIAFLIFLLT